MIALLSIAGSQGCQADGEQRALAAVGTPLTATASAKLTASDAEADDGFGHSVAIDSDRLVVGASTRDLPGIVRAGAAYVFERVNDSWQQVGILQANDAVHDQIFGSAVAISGNTVVVGAPAPSYFGAAPETGSAYVFVDDGGGWSQVAKLTPSDGSVNDFFGVSVGMANGRIVVGAWGHDALGASGAGAVYVFTNDGNGWSEQQKLLPSNGGVSDHFGHALGVSGDRVVAASPKGSMSVDPLGSAYVFEWDGMAFVETVELRAAAISSPSDCFAKDVDIDGDRIVAGAYLANLTFDRSGAAYLFEHDGQDWSETTTFEEPQDGVLGYGQVVGVSSTAVVAAMPDDSSATGEAGRLFVNTVEQAQWVSQELVANDAAVDWRFGADVDVTANLLVVGAPGADGHGATYLYLLEEDGGMGGGGAGGASAGGMGGAPTSSGAGGSGGAEAPPPVANGATDVDGDCSCRLVDSAPSDHRAWLLLAMPISGLLLRRRQRHFGAR